MHPNTASIAALTAANPTFGQAKAPEPASYKKSLFKVKPHPSFSRSTYNEVYGVLRHALQLEAPESTELDAVIASYKLAIIFETPQEALATIAQVAQHHHSAQPIADTLRFKIPRNNNWNPEPWRNALLAADHSHQHGQHLLQSIKQAIHLETTLFELHEIKQIGRWLHAIAASPEHAFETFKRHCFKKAVHDAPLSGAKKQAILRTVKAANSPQPTPEDALQLVSPLTYGVEMEVFGVPTPLIATMRSIGAAFPTPWVMDHDASITPPSPIKRTLPEGSAASQIIEPARVIDGVSNGMNTKGFEVVSPILDNGNVGQLPHIMDCLTLLGAKANKSCALHVHAGIVNSFSAEQQLPVIKQALINYICLEDALSFMDSPLVHRYDATFAKEGTTTKQAIEAIIAAPDLDSVMAIVQPGLDSKSGTGRRRGKINLHSLEAFGTIEFRQHPGTAQKNEVIAWLRFVDGFMDISQKMALDEIGVRLPSVDEQTQLEGLVSRYIEERRPTMYHRANGFTSVLGKQRDNFVASTTGSRGQSMQQVA